MEGGRVARAKGLEQLSSPFQMQRLIGRIADHYAERDRIRQWLESTPDGNLIDFDIFNHKDTFTVEAFADNGTRGFCPIQQPLMMENLIFRPGLTERETAQVIAKLGDYAIEEAYRRDAGEIYFLCRDQSTCDFALRHGFKDIAELGLKTFRLNLLETFGR